MLLDTSACAYIPTRCHLLPWGDWPDAYYGGCTSYASSEYCNTCYTLRQLTSVKTECTWNAAYKKLFDKEKSIIKEDVYMKFYDETKPLYLETDVSGVGLGASLLQTRSSTSWLRDTVPYNSILRPIAFASKSLSSTEKKYSNIEREVLGILHGLKIVHH